MRSTVQTKLAERIAAAGASTVVQSRTGARAKETKGLGGSERAAGGLADTPRMVAQRQQLKSMFGNAIQREVGPDEEELQMKAAPGVLQRQGAEDEELLQGRFATVQKQGLEDEEELVQGRFETAQRQEEEEDALQMKAARAAPTQREAESLPPPNRTGLPDGLKSGIESLSGIAMDHVRVHYSSAQPAQLNALAYAQGSDIHVAPGQEQHLPHEAWHVVQQTQGRVQPTMQRKRCVPINDDASLEAEADQMGQRMRTAGAPVQRVAAVSTAAAPPVAQLKIDGPLPEFRKAVEAYAKYPKKPSQGLTQIIDRLYYEARGSLRDYEMDTLAATLASLNFDERKISAWLEGDFLLDQRQALDTEVLHGEGAHGGKKHLGLSKKEQTKRLEEEANKPRPGTTKGTSVKKSRELLELHTKIKDTLVPALTDFLEDKVESLWNRLTAGRTKAELQNLADSWETEWENDSYKLEFTFGLSAFTKNTTVTLVVTPTLTSHEEFPVSNFERVTKAHWKTKKKTATVVESEDSKPLKMFWGSQRLSIVLTSAPEQDFRELVAAAAHGGVTLF